MLDECKGEKLEEVLAAFSTIVLHKMLAAEKNHNSTIAKHLALTSKLKSNELKSLLPLAVAHRASLTAVLHRKELLRSRYKEFQRMLDGKSKDLRQQHECFAQAKKIDTAPEVSEQALQKIRKRYDTHWQGDPRWLNIILNGDVTQDHDVLLETPFENTWEELAKGTVLDTHSGNKQEGLLQDLKNRIAAQQNRLQHWKEYREKLTAEAKFPASETSIVESPELAREFAIDFSVHKDINTRQAKILQRPLKPALGKDHTTRIPMDDEYAQLVKSMRQDLDDIDAPNQHEFKVLRSQEVDQSSTNHMRSAFDLLDTPMVGARRTNDDKSRRDGIEGRGTVLPTPRNKRQNEAQPNTSQAFRGPDPKVDIAAPTNDTPETSGLETNSEREDYIHSTRLIETTLDDADHWVAGNDEGSMLAAQIIAATMNASPSPGKSKPSLVERTRRSMALASPVDPYHLSSKFTIQEKRREEAPLASLPISTGDTDATLLERTRRSMSLLPAQPRESRRSMHNHRRSKQFPVNQFETPRKQAPILEDVKEMTPPEKLFSEDADYASVFKSRPKIAMSPTGSPTPKGSPGMDAIVDSMDDNHQAEHWESSPLARIAGKAGL